MTRGKWVERLLVLCVAFIFYTWMDLSATPFWAGAVIHSDVTVTIAYQMYYFVWQIALYGMMLLLGIAYRNPLLSLTLWLLSRNGAEDMGYYLLQGQPLPGALPWLHGDPLVLQPASWASLLLGAVWGVPLALLTTRFDFVLALKREFMPAMKRRMQPGWNELFLLQVRLRIPRPILRAADVLREPPAEEG